VLAAPDIAPVAALIAEPARALFLEALADDVALPASELAARARITNQTASGHLARLLDGGLVQVERHGRHRYYRLANRTVAEALEALAVIAPARRPRSLRESAAGEALARARTCYDHLAGRLGVELTEALETTGALRPQADGWEVTAEGAAALAELGIDAAELSKGRRPLTRRCLDWSERRHHLAGALGAALAARLLELGWIERIPGGRAVRTTELGQRELARRFRN
jgi:DNA-binding transcriptional ArsR family regulator